MRMLRSRRFDLPQPNRTRKQTPLKMIEPAVLGEEVLGGIKDEEEKEGGRAMEEEES